jgi:multicomponent Na+:H+ antiporter subunit A
MSLIAMVAATAGLAAIAPILAQVVGRAAGWLLGAGLLGVAAALVHNYPGAGAVHDSLTWLPTIEVALRLRLDGLSFLFAMVVVVIGAVVMIYSASYLTGRKPVGFYTLMTAFAAAMLLLVLADDLVVLFVAWELTTLCSYLLILSSGPTAGPPATRTLLITVAGGLCLLGAVALVAIRTGTTDLTVALTHPLWADDPVFGATAAVLVAVAAMTKSAQFPFHSWLPDAMVAPAPVSAYLHAAAMVKAGIFLLMLFADAASNAPVWPMLLIGVGLLTAVMGAVFALQRNDLKELLAYSTVSQLGLLVAVIGVGTTEAMLAASVHVVAHALFKSAAFMHIGFLERRVGTRYIGELSGLARAMPWDAAMIALAAISMAGIPPALGFVSKELIFDSMLGTPGGPAVGWLVALVAAVGAALTVAYSARMIVTTLPGPAAQVRAGTRTASMSLAVSLTALGGAVLGAAVWLLDDVVGTSAAVAAGVEFSEVHGLYLWHGFNAPLALSAAAIAAGVMLTVRRGRVDRLLARPLFPGSGVGVVQWAQDAAVVAGRRVGDLTRADAPAAHLVVPAGLVGLGSLGVAASWPGLPDPMRPQAVDVGLLVVMAVGIVTVTRAEARLTAVIAVGVAGFSVALWFFVLGASDVALTQLLVEILTVVIMVLVLRRMRWRFATVRPRRSVLAAVAALAAGAAATLAALAFTGHRSLSPVGEYFLREAENETGGTNVVNTILVDFRALDTLGELVVLAVAALAMAALLDARRLVTGPDSGPPETPLADPRRNAVFLAVLDRALVPLMLAGSVYVLLRGHNAPGGGFIGALIGASALALAYLSASSDHAPRLYRPYLAIAGSGIVVAVGSGLLGLAEGSFLRPLHVDVLGMHLTSALVFDVGVYLAVFGVILAALNLLGTSRLAAGIEGDLRPGDHDTREVGP